MKICSGCGASIGDNERFCSRCGMRQAEENAQSQASSGQNIQNQYQQNTQNGYSRMQSSPNGGYPQGTDGGQYGNMQPPTSAMAIASLVLSIAGVFLSWFTFAVPSILGLIFGIIAINPCKRGEKSGYGMSLAGIIISAIIIVIFVIFVICAAFIVSTAINGYNMYYDFYDIFS